jgi:hypothetical protein
MLMIWTVVLTVFSFLSYGMFNYFATVCFYVSEIVIKPYTYQVILLHPSREKSKLLL